MILVTFADSRYRADLRRLTRQARRIGSYRKVLAFTEDDLEPDFRRRHATILDGTVRGFGFWIWKPHVILRALGSALPGEIVNYLDAGFFINPRGVRRLAGYESLAALAEGGVLGFKAVPPSSDELRWDGRPLPVWRNKEWTKRILLERCDLQDDPAFLEDLTYEAGAILVRNDLDGSGFVEAWLALMEEDYANIDDSVSPGGEEPHFREHRHDQACFSILAHRRNIPFVSSFEYRYPAGRHRSPDWAAHPDLPFQKRGLRDRRPTKRQELRSRLMTRARRVLSAGHGRGTPAC